MLAVERGEVDEVLREIAGVEATIRDLLTTGRTPLPEYADMAAMTAWCTHAHRRFWGWD